MTAYRSMKSKLEPLGVYSLAEGGAVDCELKAYAAGIEPLLQELELLEREGFIATSESFGLSERELFIDREKSSLSDEKRRLLLLGYEQSLGSKGTPGDFVRELESFGLEDYHYSEHCGQRVLNIYIDEDLTDGRKSLISKKIKQISPAHVYVSIVYNDSTSETF